MVSINGSKIMDKKVALVTNALDFVGPPAVDALVEERYFVIAQDRSFENTEKRHQFEQDYPSVHITSTTNPNELIDEAWGVGQRLDILISNDSFPAVHAPIEQANVKDLTDTLHNLLVYPFELMQSAIPKLKGQGSGNIIMVTSCRTELPMPGGAIPDAARAGANALVKTLSIELAPFGIPVNAIAPNYLYSEAYFPKAKFIDDPVGSEFIRNVVPAGRLGDPKEIGELVKYLASMVGAFHTGTVIKFAGGWPAAPTRPV